MRLHNVKITIRHWKKKTFCDRTSLFCACSNRCIMRRLGNKPLHAHVCSDGPWLPSFWPTTNFVSCFHLFPLFPFFVSPTTICSRSDDKLSSLLSELCCWLASPSYFLLCPLRLSSFVSFCFAFPPRSYLNSHLHSLLRSAAVILDFYSVCICAPFSQFFISFLFDLSVAG